MQKSNLKEIIAIIKQNVENEEVELEIIYLPNHKIKHIIIGNKKVIKPKNQSSMNTKQFQEFVIEFIKKQDETNKIVVQRLDRIENDIKLIKSCPTIKKELKDIS